MTSRSGTLDMWAPCRIDILAQTYSAARLRLITDYVRTSNLQTSTSPGSDGNSSRAVNVAHAVQAARIEFAFNGLPLSLAVSVLLAGMTAIMLRRDAPPVILGGWFTCLLLINAIRSGQYVRYRRQRSRGDRDPDLD